MKYYTFICKNCNKSFKRTSRNFGKNGKEPSFCSRKCFREESSHTVSHIRCGNCNNIFHRKTSKIKPSKSGKYFCSQSCSATYNNTHKTHGTRRSKLEAHLEEYIRSKYPSVKLLCNSKEEIGSELDFYFPELKFAIELNGIFHYEPIYGEDKLERIQDNDKQKMLMCYEKGIELAIIDSSHIKNLTKNHKHKMESIIDSLLEKVLSRLEL